MIKNHDAAFNNWFISKNLDESCRVAARKAWNEMRNRAISLLFKFNDGFYVDHNKVEEELRKL